MTDKIYMQNILDHFHSPENYGRLKEFTHNFKLQNFSCGDVLEVWLNVKENVVVAIGFEGSGCAVSQASMSILSEFIIGKNLQEINVLSKDDLMGLLGIELSPNRLKCALMSLEIVQKIKD